MATVKLDKKKGAKNMDIKTIQAAVNNIAKEYPIKKITLFGSRANGTNRTNSDIDLIMEFYAPVSLLTLSKIKLHLEKILKLNVDIVHGPIRNDDLLDIKKEVQLYVAQRQNNTKKSNL